MDGKAQPEPAKAPWPLAIWCLVGGLFACLLIFLPSSVLWMERFTLPKEIVLHVTAGLVAASCLLRARRLRWDAIDLLIASCLVLGLISTVFVARNPWFAARSMAIFVSGAILFWSARAMAERGQRDQLLLWSALAVGTLAIIVVLEAHGVLDGLSLRGRAPGGTTGNRNRAAHLQVVALPVLWVCVARARKRLSLDLLLVLTAAATGVLVLSRSRAAWLAAGLVMAVALTTELVMRRRIRPSMRTALFAGTAVLGVALAILIPNALTWTAATPYLDTLKHLTDHESGSGRGRVIQYVNTLGMVREHAWLGVGPGNWTIEYPRYASPGDPSYFPNLFRPTDPLPQGSWIGIAAEWGVPALLMLVLTGFLLARGAWRQIRSARPADRPLQESALLCVLTAVLVIGAFDPVVQLPLAMFLIALVVGALAPTRLTTHLVPLSRRAREAAILPLAALTFCSALQCGRRIGATHLMGSWSLTHATPLRLERAVRIDPAHYEAYVLLGAFWILHGRCDLALPPLRRAARLFPTASPISKLRARCWHSGPDGESAPEAE